MSILYWGRGFERFKASLKAQRPGKRFPGHVYSKTNLDDLSSELTMHGDELQVVVLAPASQQELDALLKLAPILSGMSVVILLPNDNSKMTETAHRLHPRFVTSDGQPLADVAEVVLNVVRKSQPQGS